MGLNKVDLLLCLFYFQLKSTDSGHRKIGDADTVQGSCCRRGENRRRRRRRGGGEGAGEGGNEMTGQVKEKGREREE